MCTHNHADSLAPTLQSLAAVQVPPGWSCQLLVVDNASTDHTKSIIQSAPISSMPVIYLHEPRKGQNNAYNLGLTAATGDVILFTDDDIRFPANWIEAMATPILNGEADAVGGGVHIAPHLERPWMQQIHRTMQAETTFLDPLNPEYLVAANLAIRRKVFDTIPAFDPELGPGALGYGGEYLLLKQMRLAGFRLTTRFHIAVEHHFDESRLLRKNWLDVAKRQGKTGGYIAHHWEHKEIPLIRLHAVARSIRLSLWKLSHPAALRRKDGCDARELELLRSASFYANLLKERRRPRRYTTPKALQVPVT
ncbi:MAG TPA: glycosyltransferase family 2 protein [Verrucomicrobiae bacterium]|nr:glycosyltransferase family 2 protein [Verrucomicrobiae bacterium]